MDLFAHSLQRYWITSPFSISIWINLLNYLNLVVKILKVGQICSTNEVGRVGPMGILLALEATETGTFFSFFDKLRWLYRLIQDLAAPEQSVIYLFLLVPSC